MAKELSVEEAVQRAQQLQEDRIGAIRGLAEARQNLADTRDEAARKVAEVQREAAELVAAAEREDVKRYAAAQAAGWSADELRKVGYQEPDKKARVRKRQARKASSSAEPGDAAGVAGDSAAE
jgi:hypothetical protein